MKEVEKWIPQINGKPVTWLVDGQWNAPMGLGVRWRVYPKEKEFSGWGGFLTIIRQTEFSQRQDYPPVFKVEFHWQETIYGPVCEVTGCVVNHDHLMGYLQDFDARKLSERQISYTDHSYRDLMGRLPL